MLERKTCLTSLLVPAVPEVTVVVPSLMTERNPAIHAPDCEMADLVYIFLDLVR